MRTLKKKEGKDRKSSTNAYSRKGCVRKKLYTNACDKKEEEKTTNVGGKRKMAALTSKQTADTKWKKDQTTKAGGKRKRADTKWKTKPQNLVANKEGRPNQASKQMTPNERNKTAETTSEMQTVAYLQT